MSPRTQYTLSFSVLSGLRSMDEEFPLERTAEAYDRMMSGKAKYRCVFLGMVTGTYFDTFDVA
jgi:D-arabinose 1-dehydrogenase-like Zn-dependent alcohol dehydrogenase